MRRSLLALLALAAGACNIIIDPDLGRKPAAPGERPEGWPSSADGGCEALGAHVLPTAQVLMLVRLTHATLGLAGEVEAVRQRVRQALYENGYIVSHTLVAPLVPEVGASAAFFWDSCAMPAPVTLHDAVAYHAAHVSGANTVSCEHEALAELGASLEYQVPSYPADLAGGFGGAGQFFEALGSPLVVVYVDGRGRNHALSACSVAGQPVVDHFSAVGPAGLSWLSLDGQSLGMGAVTHLAIVTSEDESSAEMAARCLATPGVRPAVIDVLAASPHPYFVPFVEAYAEAGGRAEILDLCEVLGTDGPAALEAALPTLPTSLAELAP